MKSYEIGKFTVIIDICRFIMTTQRVYRTIITQTSSVDLESSSATCLSDSQLKSFLQYFYLICVQIFEIQINFMAGRRVRQKLDSNLNGLKLSFDPNRVKLTLFQINH